MVDFTEKTRREARVLSIQREIDEGLYDDSVEKLEAAIDKMLDLQDAPEQDERTRSHKPR